MKISEFKNTLGKSIKRQDLLRFKEAFPKVFQKLLEQQNANKKGRPDGRLKGSILHQYLFGITTCPCGAETNWMPEGHFATFCSKYCADSSESTLAKRKATCLKRYGGEPNLHPTIQKKKKKVFLDKYGVDNPSKLEVIKEKKRQTSLSNFGVEHWSKTKEGKDSMRLYNPMHDETIKDKQQQTNIAKYGGITPMSSKSVKAKIRKTNLDRYGVENAGVLPKFKRKECFDSTGKRHIVQGYEPKAILWLSDKTNIISIASNKKAIPKIKYTLNGQTRIYYPDLVATLKSGTKRIIEVKGSYPLKCCFETNILKFKAASEYAGRKGCEFWLFYYTDKGDLIKIKSPSRNDLLALPGLQLGPRL